ncbi:protein FAM161A [Neosynchiropus ocellatus]
MSNPHRRNVLVTSCLKTPVDPHTKAPLASYERERVLPCSAPAHMDNRDYEKELEYEDSGSDYCDDDVIRDHRTAGERLDLNEIFFSNKEYYSKLEELKKAHLRTMAELENMYRHKLQLQALAPLDVFRQEAGPKYRPLFRMSGSDHGPDVHLSSAFSSTRLSLAMTGSYGGPHLRKSHSAIELRRDSAPSDFLDGAEAANNDVEKGLQFSPKEHIKNMWQDFKLSPKRRHRSTSSLPADQSSRIGKDKVKTRKEGEQKAGTRRVTTARPFHMTVREAAGRRRGAKTRTEVEHENAELRRQLEELAECQTKFRASPVPAHVHLPLYEELQKRNVERRKAMQEQEEQRMRRIQKPFSFLEREQLKKEKQQQRPLQAASQEKVKPFKAKPVPKSVYAAAASGEQVKEEELYRSIKIQMRAEEMLHSASMPHSMLARRLSGRKPSKDGKAPGEDSFSHRPQINTEVPDFDASYRRFKRNLEKRKEVKPTTACEPFELKTSLISSHKDRILADIEKDQSSPRMQRWPYISPGSPRTPTSSLCSSLSGSLEVLPAKVTDATKKRYEAVRQALEHRRKMEEAEERWREKKKLKEKRLQREVLKRAQANDPHLTLAQTQQTKLKEFRKQDQLRRKEYRQEIKEIRERVKGRPLLLEQVAQKNAKLAAEKRFTDKLHGCDLTEDFINEKARSAAKESSSRRSEEEEADGGFEPVRFRKVFLDDDEDTDSDRKEEPEPDRCSSSEDGERQSPCYSDDHESYSEEDEDAASDRPSSSAGP